MGCFKVTIWGCKATEEVEGILMGKVGFPLCNTAVLKLYYKPYCLTGYCKRFYRMPFFPIFLLFYLFCICLRLARPKCKLKCPKVYEINL